MFEIGSSLREARLRQGLDFAELEQATKIRAKQLKALEDEEFDLLPAQTYVKGFLRTYAEALGLDGQLYVDEFNSRFTTGEDEPGPIARTGVGSRSRHINSRAVLLVLLGIAAVTGLVIAAGRSGGDETPIPKVGRNNDEPNKPPRKPRRRKPAPPVKAKLLLTATQGPSWIEAHVASPAGRQLYEGTLEQGSTLPLRAKKLWLRVGQPGSLTWKLNGKLRPAPGSDVGNFVVTPKGIVSAPSSA